jgi:putative ABC transport system permease protein
VIGSCWEKVIRDLWHNKVRTLLVVLSIAAGISGIGTVAHMYFIMSRDLAQSYAEVRPANAIL